MSRFAPTGTAGADALRRSRTALVALMIALATAVAGCKPAATEAGHEPPTTTATATATPTATATATTTATSSSEAEAGFAVPTRIDVPDDLCSALDVPAAQEVIGGVTEVSSIGPDEIPGNHVCMIKEDTGDDQAPAVLVWVTDNTSEQEERDALAGNEQALDRACVVSTRGPFNTRTCDGSGPLYDPGDSVRSYNLWFMAGTTSVNCGVALAHEFPIDEAEDVCRHQLETLSR
jgi:hypothetical protein